MKSSIMMRKILHKIYQEELRRVEDQERETRQQLEEQKSHTPSFQQTLQQRLVFSSGI